MTQQEIESLFREWQTRLKLNHWNIRVMWQTVWAAPNDPIAESEPDSMYDYAKVRLDTELEHRTRDFVEKTLIHELLHLHDRDRSNVLAQVEHCLNPDAFKLWEKIEYEMTEGFIDRMATILWEVHNLTE